MSVINEVNAKVTRKDGNISVESGEQLFFLWENIDRADFSEIETKENNENLIRAFRFTNTGCHIQFRAHQSLKGNQKARNVIATAFVSIEELELILSKIKKH